MKTKKLVIRMDPKQLKMFDRYCRKRKITMSDRIRNWVDNVTVDEEVRVLDSKNT